MALTPSKTADVFFSWGGATIKEVAANTIEKSTEIDVSTIFTAQMYIHFAPTSTSAITVGPMLQVQSTPFATGDAGWMPIINPYIFLTTTPNSNAVDGTEAAGSTVIEETTTTGLANGVVVFFKNGTLANSEWAGVWSVTASTSFTLVDGLTNAQTGSTWFNLGQVYRPIVDLSGVKRIRCVVDNNRNATARACVIRVGMVELSSIATT